MRDRISCFRGSAARDPPSARVRGELLFRGVPAEGPPERARRAHAGPPERGVRRGNLFQGGEGPPGASAGQRRCSPGNAGPPERGVRSGNLFEGGEGPPGASADQRRCSPGNLFRGWEGVPRDTATRFWHLCVAILMTVRGIRVAHNFDLMTVTSFSMIQPIVSMTVAGMDQELKHNVPAFTSG